MDPEIALAIVQSEKRMTDELTIVRNAQMATRMLALAIAKTHPNPSALAHEFHQDSERAIAELLAMGFPETIHQQAKQDLDSLNEYLTRFAQFHAASNSD